MSDDIDDASGDPIDTPIKRFQFVNLFLIAGYLLIIPNILTFLARIAWPFDLCCHFRVQYIIGFFICLLITLLQEKKYHSILFGIFLLYNILIVSPAYISPDKSEHSKNTPTITLLLYNVFSANTRYDDLIRYINKESPHIIILEEVTPSWWDALEEVKKEYPYIKSEIRTDNFGIAVLSKIPLQDITIEYLSDRQVPSICANFEFNGNTIFLIGTHPLPPRSGDYCKNRNEQFKNLALRAAEHDNCIVIGDLNCTPWSPYFSKFLKDGKLTDTGRGYGMSPTWPTINPLFYIPIDHCLISGNLTVKSRYIGPNLGSDHFPLVVHLQ